MRDSELEKAVKRGLEDAKAGRVVHKGSFSKYAADKYNDMSVKDVEVLREHFLPKGRGRPSKMAKMLSRALNELEDNILADMCEVEFVSEGELAVEQIQYLRRLFIAEDSDLIQYQLLSRALGQAEEHILKCGDDEDVEKFDQKASAKFDQEALAKLNMAAKMAKMKKIMYGIGDVAFVVGLAVVFCYFMGWL